MILNIMAYGVIPIFTFLFVRGTDLFTTNFSVIYPVGNYHRILLLLCAEKNDCMPAKK